ncbi:hypothetical protein PS663_02804 [Pseudomonas fluorescens]|nr:hypothetical protein PS663_02804 [Pseudomonas fluorescens]
MLEEETTSPRQIDDSPRGSEESRKAFVPPIMRIPDVSFASWSNDRLQEMLMGHDASVSQRASMAT